MKCIARWVLAALLLAATAIAQDEPPPDQVPAQAKENQIALFNGKDFTGFVFCMLNDAKPANTWTVTNGVIHCTGAPLGYLRTTQSYSNYFLTVAWRYTKVAPNADNTGILVHMQLPDQIWPKCIKVQGRHTRLGDLLMMEGADSKEHKGLGKETPVPFRGPSREKPVGEWNVSETICIHNTVVSFINGFFVNETSETTLNEGFIGIQSNGGDIEIKSIHFSPLKY